MTHSWESLRQAILLETGIGYGPNNGVYTLTGGGASSVTLGALANSLLLGGETKNLYIFLPDSATAADREKPAGALTVATGVVANAGIAYAGTAPTSGDQCELLQYISPTQLFNVVVSKFKALNETVLMPLGSFADSDMETSGVTNWTASSSALSKVTSSAHVLTGRQSLFVNLSGANGYAESPAVAASPQANIWVSAMAQPNGGTATLTLWDNTNSASISSTTYTGQRWGHMWLSSGIPDTCYSITVRVGGTGASDDIYVDHVSGPFDTSSDLNIVAQSWLNEPWRLRKLRQAHYIGQRLGNQVEEGSSRTFNDWALHEEIAFNVTPADVNPGVIQLRKFPPSGDLWIEADRSVNDLVSTTWANTAAGEAYTVAVADRLIVLECSLAVCDYILAKNDKNTDIAVAGARIARELAAYRAAQGQTDLPPQ